MSEVTTLDFRDRLFTAFDAYWAKRTEIAAPNVDFNPDSIPSSDAWVRLYILGDTDGQRRLSGSVARNHYSRSGRFTIEVYVRQGTDLDVAYELAEAAIEFLERDDVVDDAKFSSISPPQEIGPDGTWFQVTVSASFVYWTDRAA